MGGERDAGVAGLGQQVVVERARPDSAQHAGHAVGGERVGPFEESDLLWRGRLPEFEQRARPVDDVFPPGGEAQGVDEVGGRVDLVRRAVGFPAGHADLRVGVDALAAENLFDRARTAARLVGQGKALEALGAD